MYLSVLDCEKPPRAGRRVQVSDREVQDSPDVRPAVRRVLDGETDMVHQ